ncbi:MAG: hypothetical protein RJA36_2618 [Pseudomonadota bacterium]|jgi:Cu/Ag efflux protein CusF
MNTLEKILFTSALAMGVALPAIGLAQAATDRSESATAPADAMTEGEVRKVELESAKVTIRHGEIRQLDMPAMTMVFTAKDKTLLANVKPGDRIWFVAASEGGRMVVTDLQPAR